LSAEGAAMPAHRISVLVESSKGVPVLVVRPARPRRPCTRHSADAQTHEHYTAGRYHAPKAVRPLITKPKAVVTAPVPGDRRWGVAGCDPAEPRPPVRADIDSGEPPVWFQKQNVS
jgi:hypothetical protein